MLNLYWFDFFAYLSYNKSNQWSLGTDISYTADCRQSIAQRVHSCVQQDGCEAARRAGLRQPRLLDGREALRNAAISPSVRPSVCLSHAPKA